MASATLPVLGDREFKHLQALMAEVSGIRMSEHKRPLMAGRLMRRLRALGLSSYSDYLTLLSDSKQQEERRLVIDLLTTNETYFFRESQHFTFLANWLGGQHGPLRLWSAACSSGEEPYTLAMVMAEHAKHDDWSILGSDLSQRMLEKARAAVYEMDEAKEFPAGWLQRHCLRGVGDYEGKFRIGQALHRRLTFREINLMRPLPDDVDGFDLIFLRNVLIYFTPEDKHAIVARLHGLGLPLRSVAPSVYRPQ